MDKLIKYITLAYCRGARIGEITMMVMHNDFLASCYTSDASRYASPTLLPIILGGIYEDQTR